MRESRAGRWIAVGAALSSVGATAAVGFWVFTLQDSSQRSFWSLPGVASVIVLALGLLMLGVGLVAPDESAGTSQSQRGGDSSTNVQAGRDVRFRGTGDGE